MPVKPGWVRVARATASITVAVVFPLPYPAQYQRHSADSRWKSA